MQNLARSVADACFENDVILLNGTLGSGKTAFATFFIQALSESKQHVSSPTFPIMLEYETRKGMVRHFDLYRLKNYEEIFHVGLEESMQSGLTLVEWPDIATSLFPSDSACISIKHIPEDDNGRRVEITAPHHIVSHLCHR